MKTILITGGAGFIGSNLIEKILDSKKDWKVVCVDNLDPFYNIKFKEQNIEPFLNSNAFVFYKTDICDQASLKEIFEKEKPNIVVHLAAKADTRSSVKNPDIYEKVNIGGTLNLLELSKENKIEKFIFISTSSVYGNGVQAPFKENDSTDYPLAPYGATKKSGEVLSYTYFHNFQLPVICLRIFNAYGERNRPDLVIYKWIENILEDKPIEISGTGERKRDFTYVGDVVDAILLSIEKEIGYEIINVGNSNPLSLKELLSKIEGVLGKKANIIERPSHHASVEITCADISKAKEILGWEPKVSMEEGLSRFALWFRNNRL